MPAMPEAIESVDERSEEYGSATPRAARLGVPPCTSRVAAKRLGA
jgi:hypothetical protein